MKALKRLFAPSEVRVALGVLDELEYAFVRTTPSYEFANLFDAVAFKLAREPVERMIMSDMGKFVEVMGGKVSPRTMVLRSLVSASANHLATGNYHIYRGLLNPMAPGNGLLRIHSECIAALVALDALSTEDARAETDDLREHMRSCG